MIVWWYNEMINRYTLLSLLWLLACTSSRSSMRSSTIFVRLYNHAPLPPPIRSALSCNAAAAASAATAGGAGGARARGWRSWRRARTRVAAAGCVFPKLKHIQLIWEGPHRSAYPAAIATQAVAKQSKHQARRRRPGQQPAPQEITIL